MYIQCILHLYCISVWVSTFKSEREEKNGIPNDLGFFLYKHLFLQFRNKRDILTRIDKLPFLDQTTNTPAAIRFMRDVMFTRQRGDRSDAPNVAIIITDGVPR